MAFGMWLFVIKMIERTPFVHWCRRYREGKGIWGTWVVGMGKGGFQIWPLSEGGPVKIEEETELEEKPATATK